MNIIETIFQVIFVIIMTMGILGLPVYFWLNARRKRLNAEYEQNKNNKSDE